MGVLLFLKVQLLYFQALFTELNYLFSFQSYTLFFYKNIVYKNIQAQIYLKFKNKIRIQFSLDFFNLLELFDKTTYSTFIYIISFSSRFYFLSILRYLLYVTHYYIHNLWFYFALSPYKFQVSHFYLSPKFPVPYHIRIF